VIAGNTCRDALRKLSRNRTEPLHEHHAEVIHTTGSDRLGAQDEAKMLRSALARLPDEQRLVLILKEYEGLKFHEIARILDVPESTVKTRLYTALKTMRTLMKHYER
jgi:RNA polymerase sigma-70 factor (ECF subfamily)